MKRYAACFAMLGLCTGLFAADLVKNGDFETDADWVSDSPKEKPGFSYLEEGAFSGKRCMKVDLYAYQGVRLEKGKSYKLTVSVKCKDVPQDGFCVKILKFENGKPVGWVQEQGVYQLVRSGGTHDWKTLTRVIPARMIGEGVSGCLFVANEKKAGEIFVDDLSLELLPDEGTAPASGK